MPRLLSKICARLDTHVDLRNDWPAIVASAALFVGTIALGIAVLMRPARAADAPLAARIDWAIEAVAHGVPRASSHVLSSVGYRVWFERAPSRQCSKRAKRQRLARHKRRRG